MNCQSVRERLIDYLDGALEPTGRLIVDVHVAQCPACQAELRDLQEFTSLCRSTLRHPFPVSDFDALRDRMFEQELEDITAWPEPTLPAVTWKQALAKTAIAAGLVVIATISSMWMTQTVRHVRDAMGRAPRVEAVESDAAEVAMYHAVTRWNDRVEASTDALTLQRNPR